MISAGIVALGATVAWMMPPPSGRLAEAFAGTRMVEANLDLAAIPSFSRMGKPVKLGVAGVYSLAILAE